MEDFTPRNRISFGTRFLMLGFGMLVDSLQLILGLLIIGMVLNSVINAVVVPTMWFWFKISGVEYMSDRKKMMKDIALKAGEFIPLVNFLPLTTISIYISIKSADAEDQVYNESKQVEIKKQQEAKQAQANQIQYQQYAQQNI